MAAKLLAILVALSLTACAPTTKVSTPAEDIQKVMSPGEARVVLGPGDVIDVKFRFLPEMDYQQAIRPDGKISLQMVDEVMAAGLTPEELDNHLTELYSEKLKSPEITVAVVSLANQIVYVGGEVGTPGVLPLAGRLTALQAVMGSGGFKETAELESAIVIRKGADNQPVPVPINLKKVIYGNGEQADIVLQPSDVVYVPKSSIAEANQFVRQYIQDLFLFRGVGLGFTYELHADNN